MHTRPFSQACANNQQPILEIIQPLFAEVDEVLEIGSGTGQHAAYFGAAMPHLRWQTSDLPSIMPVLMRGASGRSCPMCWRRLQLM